MSVELNFEKQKEVPPEVKGWNWGAFFLTWIWGICNGTLISLLSLIPGIHFIMMFVLGVKGNEWAWRNKDWESIEQFHRTQRKWAAWAVGLWLGLIAFCIAIPVGILGWGITTEMPEIKTMLGDFSQHRRFCNYALATAERDPRYNGYFGGPLQVRGRAEAVLNETGYAEVAVPIRGPRGEGTLYLRTHRRADNNEVELEQAELELKGLQRLKLDTPAIQKEMQNTERKIVELMAAHRLKTTWKQRDPRGKEEAEELYRKVLQKTKEDPQVREFLGSNIATKVEFAKLNLEGPMGDAELTAVLTGNGQAGTMNLRFVRSMGRWSVSADEVDLQGKIVQIPVIGME